MKEFIDKLIERLEEQRGHICNCMPCNGCKYIGDCNEGEFAEDVALDKAIEIANELAEEYKDKSSIIDDLKAFLKEKFKYNSEQAEIWADGSDNDSYFRQQKDLYMDRANIYGEVMREIDRLSEEYKGGFCEWKKGKSSVFPIKTNCGNSIDINYEYEFCPYCGKKIKVAPYTEGE